MKLQSVEKQRAMSILVSMLAIIIVTGAVFGIISYVKRSIHDERKVYLTAQTNTSVALVNSEMLKYSDYIDICANIIAEDLIPGEDIFSFMDDMMEELYLNGARLILVDQNCIWYGENGTTGRITSIESYKKNTGDKLTYITTGVDVDGESFVFRVRLPKPIQVTTPTGVTEICYCAAVCYMDIMHDKVSVAFPFECNRFVVDENGLMLYMGLELGFLMDGYNIFSKYERVNFKFGDTGKEQLAQIDSGDTVVGEFLLNGENYFICTAKLDVNNWKLSYVVPAKFLSTGSYMITLTLYIAFICLILAILIVIIYVLFYHMQKKQSALDIQRKANQYLEEASKAKSSFLANMSHDIRTPINGIMGMTLLARKQNNPPKTEECLKNIDSSSQHLLSLVNDILDMSSIESGKVVFSPKPLDIRAVAENCVSIMKGQIADKGIEFIPEFSEINHPYGMIDELHLRQVLINILSNASKYTPAGGKIWFRLNELTEQNELIEQNEKSFVRFEIEDTGIGMKTEFLDHIWERFSQEEGGSRTNYKGTGLGMAITKNYVELMGGTVEAKSTLNMGSTFIVDIPFEPVEKLEESDAKTEKIEECIKGAKILLVEDNQFNRMIAEELLEYEGAIITTAENGIEAVDKFRNCPPGSFDLILMDVMMPKMDGLEATKVIRALNREDAAKIPIIAMTANAFESDIRKTLDAGMNAHLSKPINLPIILKTLSAFYHPEV